MAQTPVVKNSSLTRVELETLVGDVLDEARSQGATAAEAAVMIETGLSVSVRMGDVETLEHNHDKGLGVSVYVGQRKGSASTTDLGRQAIRDTVAAACRIARYTAEDSYAGLADAALMAHDVPDLDLCHPWEISADQAIALGLACEDAARSFDPRITNSEGASVSTHQTYRVYGNSHGFVGSYGTTRHSLSCAVVGEQDGTMQRDYWYTSSRLATELEDAAQVGRRAAERAVRRLGARRLPTGKVPVLFAADVAGSLLGAFIAAIRGGAQYRKASFLLDALDTQVFPSFVHIHEQPRLMRGIGSAPFDQEGVATRNRDLVRDGVLVSYVLDSYSARRLERQSTGNAGGVRNLVIDSGALDFAGLLRQMDRGLVVTEMMGQGANNVTGDYSRGAAGFWVENGAIQYPVEEITIAGNMRDMFRDIVAVGNDIDRRGNTCTGSILIGAMTVAGE